MSLSKALISLVVVSFVATAFAATEAQESLTFAEWSANAAGATQVGTAGSYYKKSANAKHLCLKEKAQGECRYVGCANVINCNAANASRVEQQPCPSCFTHVAGLSDVECCKDSDYYPKDPAESTGTITAPTSIGKVGTCDWDADIFKASTESCTNSVTINGEELDLPCGWVPLENGAYQIGTAWATCYLNAGAEECGHPFCDRMVLSFQGGLYFTKAYTKGVPQPPVTDNSGFFKDLGCFVPPQLTDFADFPVNRGAGKRVKAAQGRSLFKDLLAKHTGASKSAAKKTQKRSSTTDPAPTTGHEYYNGLTWMFSGAVTVTSLDNHVEYSHGLMEYVPLFVGDLTPIEGKPSATALVVKPYTYNIQLVAAPKEDYGKGGADEYKGDAGRGYYKESEGKGY